MPAPVSPPTPEIVPAGRGQPAKRCLLIVDDEEGPRMSLRMVFKDDYHLLVAASGHEAVQLTQKHRVDAAIVDIRMEGMSGIEVLQHLKAIDPAIEVIMLTAYGTLDTARQAMHWRAAEYLAKPFDLKTMRAAVEAAMERRSVSERIRANHQRLLELRREIEDQRLQEAIVRNRGDIYGSVLHEINGPLTTIGCHLGLMSEQLGSLRWLDVSSTQDLKEQLETVNRYVNNCVEIVQRYLGFLRQEGGEPECVSVNQTLKDLEMLLVAHPAAAGNGLVYGRLPEDVRVRIHGTDLLQILLRLAENALQCTPAAHRVEVTAARLEAGADRRLFCQDGPVQRFVRHEQFDPDQPLVSFRVADDGPGMSPAVLQKLFQERFTTKPPPLGTGLGLVIVRRLLLFSKCALAVQSAPGQGTRFTVFIPLAPEGG